MAEFNLDDDPVGIYVLPRPAAVASVLQGLRNGGTITFGDGGTSGFTITTTSAGGTFYTQTIAVSNAGTARGALGIDAIATKKSNLVATIAPAVGNDSSQGYGVGSFWLGTALGAAYICLDPAVGAAVWGKITP